MGRFSEIMAAHNDVVTSPDGQIKARVRDGMVTGLEFKPDTFHRYTDTALAEQMEYFSKLIAVNRRRARRNALKQALGTDEDPRPRKPDSPAAREVADRQNEVLNFVVRTENFKVHITDAHTWRIRLKPGTTQNLTEEQFVREAAEMAKLCIAQLRTRMHNLRHEVMGPSMILKGMSGVQKRR